MRELGPQDVEAAVRGGSVYASGGGGWVEHGYLVGRTATAYGRPLLAGIDEVDPEGLIVTVTAIGAPAAADWEMRPADYVRALTLLAEKIDGEVLGTITAQNGSSTTLNGWMQSAALGTVVIDAAGDIRAHPTGKMGSLGLTARPDYTTTMACAGGNRSQGRYLETVTQGLVPMCANVLRTASVESGGFIAAARNPLPVSYIAEHAALGAVSTALELGEAMVAAESRGGDAVIDAICETARGSILVRGHVRGKELRTEGGFDIGRLFIGETEVAYVNEYMTVDADGQRLSTYPDVLCTLSTRDGRPISIADIADGDDVALLCVPKAHTQIASGVLEPSVYPEVEKLMGKPLTEYALA